MQLLHTRLLCRNSPADVFRQASYGSSLKLAHPAEWLLFDAILVQNIPCPLTEMRGADELPLGSLDVMLLQVVEMSIQQVYIYVGTLV